MLRTHETATRKLPIDRVGLGLLIIWVGALQVMLDLGKNADWFHDPFIVVLALITAVGLLAWLIWELTDAHPIVDLSLLSNRNFLFGSLALCLGFAIYFANVVLLPLWLQTQLGYTATWAGLAVAPSGVIAVILTPLIARLMTVIDIRWIATISFGALVTAYMMRAGYTTDVSFATVAFGSAVQGIGSSGFFLSLLTILLDRVPPGQVPDATGLSNFVRIVIGSFATSVTTTMWDRREALHQTHLVESATPVSASYIDVIHRLGRLGLHGPGADAVVQHQLVGQAYLLSTVELYWAFAMMTGTMILFVWLTKRATAGHGAAAAE
jgi:DHA2 family multidrug resistance protein